MQVASQVHASVSQYVDSERTVWLMLEKQVTKLYTKYFLFWKQTNQKNPQIKKTQPKKPNNKEPINFCTVTAVEFQLTNETEGDMKSNV